MLVESGTLLKLLGISIIPVCLLIAYFVTDTPKYYIGKQLTRDEFIHLMSTAEVCRRKRHKELVPKFNIKRIMIQRHMLGDNQKSIAYYVIHKQFMKRKQFMRVIMNESANMYTVGSVSTCALGGHNPDGVDAVMGERTPELNNTDYYR